MIAIAVGGALGLRPVPLRASPWSEARFGGEGRTHLVVRDAEGEIVAEAFTRMLYSTDASAHRPGLLLRSSFPIPSTGRTAVLVLDLTRAQGRSLWPANEGDLVIGRYYEVPTAGGLISYDGRAEDGELALEEVVVGAAIVGFRIGGDVTFIAPGGDGLVGTGDDLVRTIALAMETSPSPDQIEPAAGGESPLPVVGVCETELCYEDPYYSESVGGGCGGVVVDEVYFEPDTSGCDSGDDIASDDGYGVNEDEAAGCEGDGGGDDGGWDDPYADEGSGCEGDTADDGWDSSYDDSSSGCEGDTADDGWDSSYDDSSSGCESDSGDDGYDGSGWDETGEACSGDTVAAPRRGASGRRSRGPRGALIAWTPFLLLLAGVLLIHRRL